MFLVCYFLRPCSITDPAVAKAVALFSSLSLSLFFYHTHSFSRFHTFRPHSHAGIYSTSLQSEREIDGQRFFGGFSQFDSPCAHFICRLNATSAIRRNDDSEGIIEFFLNLVLFIRPRISVDSDTTSRFVLFRECHS